MALYNLDKNTESFDFILGGITWTCRYPSAKELKEISKHLTETKNKDTAKTAKWLEKAFNDLISSDNPDAPKKFTDLKLNAVQEPAVANMLLKQFYNPDIDLNRYKEAEAGNV